MASTVLSATGSPLIPGGGELAATFVPIVVVAALVALVIRNRRK